MHFQIQTLTVERDSGMAGRVKDCRKPKISLCQTIGISIVRSLPKMQNGQQLGL